MSLKSIEEVLKEIADLEEKIRNADPNVVYREGGKLVNHLEQLKKRLAAAKRTLDNLQKLPKAVKAVETGQKAITVARTGGALTRAFTAIGRAIGFGSGTAATVAGLALTTVVLAGITYGAANYLGSLAGDKAIQPVPLTSQRSLHASIPREAPGCQSAGPYYIYVLDIESGGSIYVCGQAGVQKPSCQFIDGGNCGSNDPNVRVLGTIGGAHETYDQAVAAYCSMVTDIHSAYGGTKGYINGQDYWLDNAPGC